MGYLLCVYEGAWQLAYTQHVALSLLRKEQAKLSYYPYRYTGLGHTGASSLSVQPSPPPSYSSAGLANAGPLPVVAAVRCPSRPRTCSRCCDVSIMHVHASVESCLSGSARWPAGGPGRRRAWPARHRPSIDRQTKLALHTQGWGSLTLAPNMHNYYTFQSESDKPFFRKEVQAHFTEWLEETATEAPAEMEVIPTEAPALRRAKEALE